MEEEISIGIEEIGKQLKIMNENLEKIQKEMYLIRMQMPAC
jgi:hypothetical protein